MSLCVSTLNQMGVLGFYMIIGFVIAKLGIVDRKSTALLSKLENNVLEDGEPVRRTYWKTLWTAQVKIVSDWKQYATVTFAGNGGEAMLNQTVLSNGACLKEFPVAIREGYLFKGWSLRPDGSQPVDTETVIRGNTTLYAIWQQEPAPDTDNGNGLPNDQDGNDNGISDGTIANGRYHYLMRMARQYPIDRASMLPTVTSIRMVPSLGIGRSSGLRTNSGVTKYSAEIDWNNR